MKFFNRQMGILEIKKPKDSSFHKKVLPISLSTCISLFTCSFLSNIHVSTGRIEGDPLKVG